MRKIFIAAIIVCSTIHGNAQLAVGRMAPEISLPNAKDSLVNLSSYKGQIVLVDFWASWCGPCRASNPGVLRLYKKYKEKGLVVIGVSIDVNKQAWLKAVKQDKLTYQQLNDATGMDSKVTEAYNVEMIPSSFLLDKEGRIVAVDLAGKQLDKLVKGLL
jgi:peroxiredoxin